MHRVGLKSESDVTATDMDNCSSIYPLIVLVSVLLPIHPAMSAEIDDVAVANQVYPKDAQLGYNNRRVKMFDRSWRTRHLEL